MTIKKMEITAVIAANAPVVMVAAIKFVINLAIELLGKLCVACSVFLVIFCSKNDFRKLRIKSSSLTILNDMND